MSAQPVSEVNGIKFFNTRHSCKAYYEARWMRKVISLIQSYGTFLMYALSRICHILCRDGHMGALTNTGARSRIRLIVCIHGLNNNPTQFRKIVNELQKGDLSETDIFIPYVLHAGNATLDETARPIFEEIKRWARTPGEKELVLIGISNGGRISRAVEAALARDDSSFSKIKRLRFISIGGACRGSSVVNLANKVGLSCLLSKNIAEEMPVNSVRNRRLDEEWRAGSIREGLTRDYVFFASPHDWSVPDYHSTLMTVGYHNVRYAIVPGHGHQSIVNAVAKTVAHVVLN